jgi:hypothetical protein
MVSERVWCSVRQRLFWKHVTAAGDQMSLAGGSALIVADHFLSGHWKEQD